MIHLYVTSIKERQLESKLVGTGPGPRPYDYAASHFAGDDLEALFKYLDISEVGDWRQVTDRYGRQVIVARVNG